MNLIMVFMGTKILPFAFDIANGSFGFLATGVAFGGFANRGANGITSWVITLPTTFRMTFLTQAYTKHRQKYKIFHH
jgi:hypothetical protein